MAAVRALAHRRMNDAVALWACLGGRITVFTRFGRLGLDGVNGAVTGNVPGEVEHQAVGLARGKATPPAHDLHIQTCRFGWAQHGNQIHRRRVETGRQHIGIGQALNTPLISSRTDRPNFIQLGSKPVLLSPANSRLGTKSEKVMRF